MNNSSYPVSTGNPVVDTLYGKTLSGNIIPTQWCKIIKKENGHTDLLAAHIIADIIYWYRPSVKYGPDGKVIRVGKKFHGDYLQKYYDCYAELFDVSKGQVKAAFDTLESLGFVRRIFRNITQKNGAKLVNVLYIELTELAVEKLFLPFSEEDVPAENDGYTEISEQVSVKKHRPVVKNTDTITETNTKITTQSNNLIHIIPSGNCMDTKNGVSDMTDEDAYREILLENTELPELIAEQPDCADSYREIFEIMLDFVCFNRQPLKVRGNIYPAETVKKRMLDLKREHLEHVLDKYDHYSGNITDFKAHCAVTLFNSFYEVNNQLNTRARNTACAGNRLYSRAV